MKRTTIIKSIFAAVAVAASGAWADEETVGRWYDDMREGLEYIHAHGVVHRDLKLQNIMIGPDGHAVITDFGISRIFDPGGKDATVVDPVQTILRMRDGKNLVMGSIGYMAPEIEMGMPATPKSDWYALGVITYKLLTGMWCDAKTDVGETLDTYDPVWKRIIPKLLHSNPAGRECLSYALEKASDRDARELLLEERYLKEKRRGHLARHVARYVTAALLVLAAVFGFSLYEFRSQHELWRLKLENAGVLHSRVPSFDELFRIPPEAKGETVEDVDGKIVMPSIPQFEAARVDALVLTHATMAAFESGKIVAEDVVADFERLYELLDDNSVVSPFDNLHTGDATYTQVSDSNDPLRMLLRLAIDRLKASSEK